MKKLTTSDLFVSHIIRTMAFRHIYIKLRVTEEGTVISFGSDQPVDLPNSTGSQLIFDSEEAEFWPETVDLAELKSTIVGLYPDIVLTLSEDNQELMIQAKIEVPVPEKTVSAKIVDYVYTHKRTILAVDKENSFGFVMPGIGGLYTLDNFYEIIDMGDVNIDHILALDRSTFDVYCLVANYKTIVFEITNKLL